MKYMLIPVLPTLVYKSGHESVFYNDIIYKDFDSGIYRSTSLHLLSRLPSPRVGSQEVAER